MGLLLLIILILFLLGTMPTWPYSRGWGYTPFGVIFLLLIILILFSLLGHIIIIR